MTFSSFLRPTLTAALLFCALLLPTAWAASSEDTDVASSAVVAAQAAQQHDDHRSAIAFFSIAIDAGPPSNGALATTAYFGRGVSYFTIGMYERVIADFDQVIAQPGPQPTLTLGTAHLWRGYANFKLENYREAVQDFDNALVEHSNGGVLPVPYNLYRLLGLSNLKLGNHVQALADIGEAISLKPEVAFAYADLAFVYAELGDPESAIDNLAQATRLAPNNLAYRDRLLAACEPLGDDKPAGCGSIR
ncbi:MAG: tetratricopeptide repeat protein [Alphaproteobacteria bacterium]|nr:tetratricopeptide repeat protein [Alphaproteobacteria bacterium]